jgi:glycosyltransferase involved in cell wall biosynthesis
MSYSQVDFVFVNDRWIYRYLPVRINRAVLHSKPVVVIVQGFHSSWQVIWLSILLDKGAKIFIQHRAEKPGEGVRGWLQKAADKCVTGYFFSANQLAEDWLNAGIIRSREKIFNILGGSSVFSISDVQQARQITGVDGSPVYLWVGRLNNNKDPMLVVEAFARYSSINPSAKLYMIYQEETLLAPLKAFVDANGAGQVKLVGKVRHIDLAHWYNSADFVICSSHYEAGNLAVIEGMSCGCIPIVTSLSSFSEHTNNGTLGLQFEPGDVQGLLDCLNRSNKMDLAEKKKEIYAYYRQRLSPTAIVSKIYTVAGA